MAINITASLESRHRSSPRCWVGSPSRDIARRGSSGEEPDANSVARPFCSDHPSTVGVEASAIRPGVLALDIAASVSGLSRSIDVAVTGSKGTGKRVVVGNGASVRGMQSHCIVGLVVDTFDDVYFAGIGPVGAEEPAKSTSAVAVRFPATM